MLRTVLLATTLAITGCAHASHDIASATPVQETAPTTLTLALGASAALPDGSQLRYVQLVNDSRCPLTVQCIQAGSAEIQLRWTPQRGNAQTFSLHTSPQLNASNSQRVGNFVITLASLDRGIAPSATLDIATATP